MSVSFFSHPVCGVCSNRLKTVLRLHDTRDVATVISRVNISVLLFFRILLLFFCILLLFFCILLLWLWLPGFLRTRWALLAWLLLCVVLSLGFSLCLGRSILPLDFSLWLGLGALSLWFSLWLFLLFLLSLVKSGNIATCEQIDMLLLVGLALAILMK